MRSVDKFPDMNLHYRLEWELHAKVRKWRPKLGKCRAGSGYKWICWQDRGLTRLRPHWDQGRVLHFGLETGCDYTTIVRW